MISGTRGARRAKFGTNVHYTEVVVTENLDLGLDPRGPHRTQKTGSTKRECVSESLSFKNCCVIRDISYHQGVKFMHVIIKDKCSK